MQIVVRNALEVPTVRDPSGRTAKGEVTVSVTTATKTMIDRNVTAAAMEAAMAAGVAAAAMAEMTEMTGVQQPRWPRMLLSQQPLNSRALSMQRPEIASRAATVPRRPIVIRRVKMGMTTKCMARTAQNGTPAMVMITAMRVVTRAIGMQALQRKVAKSRTKTMRNRASVRALLLKLGKKPRILMIVTRTAMAPEKMERKFFPGALERKKSRQQEKIAWGREGEMWRLWCTAALIAMTALVTARSLPFKGIVASDSSRLRDVAAAAGGGGIERKRVLELGRSSQ